MFLQGLLLAAVLARANPLPNSTSSQGSVQGCRLLARQYPNLTSFPQSTEYNARVVENWSETCVQYATCIFQPTKAEEVAGAVKILVNAKTKFAVRGGGHMPNPGAAAITDGVLISLNRLTDMKLVQNNSVAQLGPGLRWGIVYDWISQYGLAVVGGRYSPVGVPGLLLGGGISYFGSQFGWAANGISNMQVVLASGEIVNANASSHSDLFWALKGGSSNFGIVTRFDLKTFPLTSIYGGFTIYDPRYLPDVINATAYYCLPLGGSADSATSVNPTITYTASTGEIQVFSISTRVGSEQNPPSLANFTRIPTLYDDKSIRRSIYFTNETTDAAYSARNQRQKFRVTSLKASPEAVFLANRTFFATIQSMPELKNVRGLALSTSHQTVTAEWLRKAREAGGDPMDLDPADGNFIGSAWEDAKDDELVDRFYWKVMAEIERQAKAQRLYYGFYYLNDSSEEVRVFDFYGRGKSSLNKLRSIARKYDREAVFQRLLSGGFKVFY